MKNIPPLIDQAIEHQGSLEFWLGSLSQDELSTLTDEVNQFTNHLAELGEQWPIFAQYLLLLIRLDLSRRELREVQSRI